MIINQVAAGGGGDKVLKTEIFTQSGTWTCPSGVEKAFVRLFGGGGGGSCGDSYGGGGGGGHMAYSELSVTPGTAYPLTIGAGGAGGKTTSNSNTGTVGSNGGITSFGTLLSASGGSGGSQSGGAGGTGGGGGAGEVLTVVAGAFPADGYGSDGGAVAQQGLAVFHP